jgi:hypothetical protein
MTTTLRLRIASLIALLFAAGHSLGGLSKWSPTGDDAVLRAMTDFHFRTMGVTRSYLDFYLGLGWSDSVFLLLQAVLLWQISSLARNGAVNVRPMIAAFALANLAGGIIASVLIFPIPVLFSAALLIALVAAWLAPPATAAAKGD